MEDHIDIISYYGSKLHIFSLHKSVTPDHPGNRSKILLPMGWFPHHSSAMVSHSLNTLSTLGCSKVCGTSLCWVKSAKRSVSDGMENNVWRWVSNILSITYRSTASQPVPSWTARLTASGISRKSWSMSSSSGRSRFRRRKCPTVLLRFAASRDSLTPIRCWRYSRCALDMCQMGKETSCGKEMWRHTLSL